MFVGFFACEKCGAVRYHVVWCRMVCCAMLCCAVVQDTVGPPFHNPRSTMIPERGHREIAPEEGNAHGACAC